MRLLTLVLFFSIQTSANKTIVVGSKKFTESVILGDVIRLGLITSGHKAEHKKELGGTRILWNALLSGDIDIYPEYTGTIEEELIQKKLSTLTEMTNELKKYGIGVSQPLGFNNTYAVGMKKDLAARLNINTISDLKNYPKIKMGWSEEFLQRKDCWPGLKKHYKLPQTNPRSLDHDIAYRALESSHIDVMDLYSTDAEVDYYDLKILEDNLNYFPKYEAVYLYRLDTLEQNPSVQTFLLKMSGQISSDVMIELNRQAKIDKRPSLEVAAGFMRDTFNKSVSYQIATRKERLVTRTIEHLTLVSLSLFVALLIAIPLGVVAAKHKILETPILWTVSAIQTIPALALLVLIIKPLNMVGLSGIGNTPAFIALILYSLLPIIRSTHIGFQQIPSHLRETALVLNLSFTTRLFKIEFPLAMKSILSGIKISAVLNVGFATLGALVGAGGYGKPILTGIRLDDYSLILEGALPAAILALLVQQIFDLVENKIMPKRRFG